MSVFQHPEGHIDIRDLSISLGEGSAAFEAVQGLDCQIEPGQFVCILGPSGCGKSTLLGALAGHLQPRTGTLNVDGAPVSGPSPQRGMVFQHHTLFPWRTVRDNVAFGLKMRGVARRERYKLAEEALATVRLEGYGKRMPSQLSGGQRQRVAMGRALVRDPKLFLFDEPLSNLDAKLRVDMRTELKKLHQRLGTTIVYVTHDQIEAMTMATKVAVMKDGVVQQLADPETIYDTPASVYVARFVGSPAMNIVPGRLVEAAGGLALRLTPASGDDLEIGPVQLSEKTGRAYRGKEVLVGIRPEHFRRAVEPAADSLEVDIEVVEPTGPDTLVFFTLGGSEVIARLPPRSIQSGKRALLGVDMAKVVVFDPQSERRIT